MINKLLLIFLAIFFVQFVFSEPIKILDVSECYNISMTINSSLVIEDNEFNLTSCIKENLSYICNCSQVFFDTKINAVNNYTFNIEYYTEVYSSPPSSSSSGGGYSKKSEGGSSCPLQTELISGKCVSLIKTEVKKNVSKTPSALNKEEEHSSPKEIPPFVKDTSSQAEGDLNKNTNYDPYKFETSQKIALFIFIMVIVGLIVWYFKYKKKTNIEVK